MSNLAMTAISNGCSVTVDRSVDEKKTRILKVAVESKDKGTKIKKVEWTDATIGQIEFTVEEAAFEGEALAPEKEVWSVLRPGCTFQVAGKIKQHKPKPPA